MRVLTHKDGDLSSFFDIIDETQGAIGDTLVKQILFNNHTEAENKGKKRG